MIMMLLALVEVKNCAFQVEKEGKNINQSKLNLCIILCSPKHQSGDANAYRERAKTHTQVGQSGYDDHDGRC